MIRKTKHLNSSPKWTYDNLPDNCLDFIVKRLDFKTRIRFECINMKWNRLINASYRLIRYVDIGDLMRSSSAYYQQDNLNYAPTVHGTLKRIGKYIQIISFGACYLSITKQIAQLVLQNCPNLKSLNFSCCIINCDLTTDLLLPLAPQIIELNLSETQWIHAEQAANLAQLFPNMCKLKNLNLSHGPIFDFDSLLSLPSRLEEIHLNNLRPNFDPDQLLLMHTPTLHTLSLNALVSIDQQTLGIISSAASDSAAAATAASNVWPYMQQQNSVFAQQQNSAYSQQQNSAAAAAAAVEGDASSNKYRLQRLALAAQPREDLDLTVLSACIWLEECDMQGNQSLNVNALQEICIHCGSLRTLDIYNCKRLYDYRPLRNAEKLTKITIGNTRHFIDEDFGLLGQLPNLQHIFLSHCFALTDEGMKEFTKNRCQNYKPLITLQLNTCIALTDGFAENLPNTVQSLGIQYGKYTDAVFNGLEKIQELKELDLTGCKFISQIGIFNLHKSLQLINMEPRKYKRRLTVWAQLTAIQKRTTPEVSDCINMIF